MAREGLNKVRFRAESRGFLARVKGAFAYLLSKVKAKASFLPVHPPLQDIGCSKYAGC
jgi:hypothetical protein